MNEDVIQAIDENGNEVNVEVLDIFQVNGYDGKDYILYTRNEPAGRNDFVTYISILEEKEDHCVFQRIESDQEFFAVQQAISEMEEGSYA